MRQLPAESISRRIAYQTVHFENVYLWIVISPLYKPVFIAAAAWIALNPAHEVDALGVEWMQISQFGMKP